MIQPLLIECFISSADLSQITILPPLAKRLAEIAPSVRIDLKFLTADLPRLLESGEADLAVGMIPQMGAGFCQQRFFASKFQCAVREGHPRVKGPLTLDQFQKESHISVTTYGIGYESLERALQAKKIRRNIGMRLPSFFGIREIIVATNYLAVVPGWFSQILSKSRNIRIWPLPFSIPSYEVTLNWHERYTRDPGHQWFRTAVQSLFEAQPPIAPPGVRTKGGAISRKGRKGIPSAVMKSVSVNHRKVIDESSRVRLTTAGTGWILISCADVRGTLAPRSRTCTVREK